MRRVAKKIAALRAPRMMAPIDTRGGLDLDPNTFKAPQPAAPTRLPQAAAPGRKSPWGKALGYTAAAGVPAAAGLGAYGYANRDDLAYDYWQGMSDEEKIQAATDAMKGDEGWIGSLISDKAKGQMRQEAIPLMMEKGLPQLLGLKDRGMMDHIMQGGSTSMPLLGGAGLGLYGLLSGNPMLAMLGLGLGGYGYYNLDQAKRQLQDPRMLRAAAGGASNLEQEGARQALRRAYSQVYPAYSLAKRFGIKTAAQRCAKKVAGQVGELMSHFQAAKLIDEVKHDHGIDSRTAAEIITALRNAQRLDARPKSIISVQEFAQSAANGLGYHLGRNIGSLMTMRPAAKNTIRRIGQGLFSGAKQLGVL